MLTNPARTLIEQVQADEDGLLTVVAAASLILPIAILADGLIQLAERLAEP